MTWRMYKSMLNWRPTTTITDFVCEAYRGRFERSRAQLLAFIALESVTKRGTKVQAKLSFSATATASALASASSSATAAAATASAPQISTFKLLPWGPLPTKPAYVPSAHLIGQIFDLVWLESEPRITETFMQVPCTPLLSADATFRIVSRMIGESSSAAYFICNGYGMPMIGGPVNSESWSEIYLYWWQIAQRADADLVLGLCTDTCCGGGPRDSHPTIRLYVAL